MFKNKLAFWLISVFILAGCGPKPTKTVWNITDQEYLETPGFNVLVFHDFYPEGDQGGIEFIHHGDRIASNGYLTARLPGGKQFPRPETAKREVNREDLQITANVDVPEFNFKYKIRVWPENSEIHLAVDLDKPLPAEWKDRVFFDLQLYPVSYFGKTYHLGEKFGVFPQEGLGPMATSMDGGAIPVPLAQGAKLEIAPEDPTLKMQIEGKHGDLQLIDGRDNSLSGWFLIRSVIPEGVDKNALEWVIRPNIIPGWQRKPMIGISQVGYHPDQEKQAIIELDNRTSSLEKAVLVRIGNDGSITEVNGAVPKDWGKFLRYKYAIYDFSSVKEPGIYEVRYGGMTSEPFSISKDVYENNVWQPTLEIYFPVQMCHMRVRDRGRIWHGACHLDDALEAPVDCVHLDGYRSYKLTETQYKPGMPVPGLNRGGWHDAGDNDLAAGSQAQTVLILCLAGEEFGINVDQTSISQNDRYVELRKPDGVSDLKQQIEHGVLNLLSGYRASGHSFDGIIENRVVRGYLGDQASYTDNLIYDSSLKPGEVRGNRSGNNDDRWVFTNHDTSLEYQVATALAAASRSLKGYNDALAAECLNTAEKAWNFEQSHKPVEQPNTYIPGHYENQEVLAACELLITTKNDKYAKRLIELLPVIKNNPGDVAWSVVRTFNLIKDDSFKGGVKDALITYKSTLDKSLAETPFGVPWHPRIWGIGWDIQDFAVTQYYLDRTFPDLFGKANVLNVVNYILGCHPGSSTSFISGIGARSLIPAYGFNMHWWSYIPGGNASGTALIRPDFPELKEPFPYLWQQAEYVMPGAATYIFCVLAADKLVNQ